MSIPQRGCQPAVLGLVYRVLGIFGLHCSMGDHELYARRPRGLMVGALKVPDPASFKVAVRRLSRLQWLGQDTTMRCGYETRRGYSHLKWAHLMIPSEFQAISDPKS